MLVICVVKSTAGANSKHRRCKLLGGSGRMLPQKFLKIKVSKMAISCNACSFSTCFTSHLFVICRNHGMKIYSFRNLLILSKIQSLNTNAGFYSVAAGQQV